MTKSCGRRWAAGVLVAGALVAGTAARELRAMADETVPVTIVADIAGTHYEVRGVGECRATADGSIYGNPAAIWHVSYAGASPLSRLNITIFQLAKGGLTQLTLVAATGKTMHEIATVGGVSGSATGRVEPQGSGAVLAVDGRTGANQPIAVRVTCSRFLPMEDNG